MAIVTTLDTNFDGPAENVVELDTDLSGNKTVIMWDLMSAVDQAALTSIVNDNGGAAPMAAPTAGYATVNFAGTVVGGNATGLDNVSAPTAGTATIDLGAAKLGTDPSGLVVVAGSTAGYQTVTIAPTFADGNAATGLTATVPATSGTDSITFSVVPANTLLGAGTYDFDVTVDGGSLQQLSITTAGGETYAAIAALMDAVVVGGSVSFNTDTFTVTSDSTGASSTVVFARGSGLNGDLFAAIEAADTTVATLNASVDGLAAVPAPNYTASITVDGVAKSISVNGDAAQTVTTLLSEINTDLAGAGTASLVSGSIRVTSATVGSSSSVSIVDTDLFDSLTGTATVETAVAGTDGAGGSTTFKAIVEVDGVAFNVAFTGAAGVTVQDVIDEIDADLGAAASVALTGGDIVITSATVGVNSKVRVYDTGFLFGKLTDYAGVSYVDGVAPRIYTATVTIDGVAVPVAVQGSAAQTFTTLVAEINTDLGVAGTAAINAGNITVTSATTGLMSTVSVTDGNLFRSCAGFAGGVKVVHGADTLLEVFTNTRTPAGTLLIDTFPHRVIGAKPAAPQFATNLLAYKKSDGKWYFYDTDVMINA